MCVVWLCVLCALPHVCCACCRKFERLREVTESLQQQKQKLCEEMERLIQEKAECVENYKAALKSLQETHEKYVYILGHT